MAKNLRAKIPESDSFIICDTNADATKKFVEESEGREVHIAGNPKEVAQKSVCCSHTADRPASQTFDDFLFYR